VSTDEGAPRGRLDRLYSPPEIGAPGKRRARAQRRDLLLAGLFVLAMAAIAIAALTLLQPGFLAGAYRVEAYFLDARGLDVGIQVVQEGYVIGLVERVTPLFPGRDDAASRCPEPPVGSPPRHARLPCFRAVLRIKDDWPIPRDSEARLDSAGLLAGDVVRIRPGSSDELLADGGVIEAEGRKPDLVAQLGMLTETIDALVNETIAPALVSLGDQIKTIESLLGTGGDEGENRERLAGAFENLRTLSQRLADSVDPQAIAAILASVRDASDNLARMTEQLKGSTRDVQKAVTNYGDLAVDVRGLVRDNRPALRRALDDTQYLLQELSTALTPILTNIEDATRNLAGLSRELRNNPATILKGREVEDETPWFK